MDPSSAVQHHHQEVCSETLESMLVSTKAEMKKPRPPEQTVKCPRCDSSNTKFCYYNNYSLSQPRYFCKSCRRYWTQGGTLRNVPVGGGCRKNKRTSSKTTSQDHSINTSPNINNPLSPLTPFSYDSGDLNLAFARLQKQTSTGHLGIENHIGHFGEHGTGNFLDALRGGFLENAPNGFNHNFYYGVENGEMGMHNYDQEMTPTTTTATSTVTTVKQEMGREGDNNRVLWGFPWQINGDGNNNMGDFDSTRRIWNGVASWHGLLNTPLM